MLRLKLDTDAVECFKLVDEVNNLAVSPRSWKEVFNRNYHPDAIADRHVAIQQLVGR
ncbi:hypothetical protein PC129_g15227 [Phytophthora cactorum]|uniref:Uncharacterized protein n=1 Tax=Phytophthora cactorum TaxID=29920 RepID=A0A329SC74_9STRA|nr:hypothetical protein Pcac1_g22448 [Phytophthora cactorum]KAG2818373.1 hypothetical protein PC111_g12329 [Phytophthora cactorum]KAG2821321.1 hypothetical protein PC112_g11422 [Phytophthora cactorum]KAG2854133.1 hypothetical protein PC113_g13580 [Phytophthora cactorum]KAG2890426.1 hypothetical protein PC114_g17477 [Phytophthora cactorum]